MISSHTRKELKPYLMENSAKGVEYPYYIVEDKNQVIFIITPGKNGIEFNKTSGFFWNFPGMQTFQCLYGSGILLMQRNDEVGEAKEFKLVTLTSFKTVIVPAGWAVCLVNTGSNYLVALRNNALEEKQMITKPIIEKRGLVYYVIEKKGEIVFEQNPKYKIYPQISTE